MLNHQNTKNLKRQKSLDRRINQRKSSLMGDDPFVIHSYDIHNPENNVSKKKKTSNDSNQRSQVFNGTSSNKTVTLSDNLNFNNNLSLAKSDKLVIISSGIDGRNNIRHNKSKRIFNSSSQALHSHNRHNKSSPQFVDFNGSLKKYNYSNSIINGRNYKNVVENKFRMGYFSENSHPDNVNRHLSSRYSTNEVSLVSEFK